MPLSERQVYICKRCNCQNSFKLTDTTDECYNCGNLIDINKINQQPNYLNSTNYSNYRQSPESPQSSTKQQNTAPTLSTNSKAKFIGWLLYWLLGSVGLYFICSFIENFDLLSNWSGFMRGVLILGILGWGGFLAWWVNND